MTLLLAVIEPRAIVYVSDRRLTVEVQDGDCARYDVAEEQYSKTLTLFTKDGRFVFGLTGLGRTSAGFVTIDWLWNTIKTLSHERNSIYDILEVLKTELTMQFSQFSLPATERRLTILVAGYIFDAGAVGPVPKCWRLSNYEEADGKNLSEAKPIFDLWYEGPEDGHLVAIAGAINSPNKGDIAKIKSLIAGGADWKALEFKAYHAFSRARLGSGGKTVGGNMNTVLMKADSPDTVSAFYYADLPSRILYAPPVIIAAGDNIPWGLQSGFLIVGELAPFITVNAERRNHTCPCGSGMRYGKCHATLEYSYLPITVEQESGGRRVTYSCYGAAKPKQRKRP